MPQSQKDRLIEFMAGGRVVIRGELERAGFARTTVFRMIRSGVLMREGNRGAFVLSEEADPNGKRDAVASALAPIARRFGGQPETPRGVICLQAAASLHGLLDIGIEMLDDGIEVGIRRGANPNTNGLPVRLVVWQPTFRGAFDTDSLEWRVFNGHGMHVTSPARTVMDMFSPWARVPAGRAMEAMARLVDFGQSEVRSVMKLARGQPWEDTVAAGYEAVVAVMNWNDGQRQSEGRRP